MEPPKLDKSFLRNPSSFWSNFFCHSHVYSRFTQTFYKSFPRSDSLVLASMRLLELSEDSSTFVDSGRVAQPLPSPTSFSSSPSVPRIFNAFSLFVRHIFFVKHYLWIDSWARVIDWCKLYCTVEAKSENTNRCEKNHCRRMYSKMGLKLPLKQTRKMTFLSVFKCIIR